MGPATSVVRVLEPKKPGLGTRPALAFRSIMWQELQFSSGPNGSKNVLRPKKRLEPSCCRGVSELSSLRIGLGGYITSRMKFVNDVMSASESCEARPSRPGNATLNALNASTSLKAPEFGWAFGSA